MFANFPEFLRTRWLQKTTDIRPIVRDGSGSPQWCGDRRRRQGTVRKYVVNNTNIVEAATTPGCTIEVARNQINVLRDHKSTNSMDNFLGNTSFLGKDIVDVK